MAQEWVGKAEENLRSAEATFKEALYPPSCFLCQQAAEMALKAVLIAKAGGYPFTHSLVDLAKELEGFPGLNLPQVEELEWLQEHYAQARYPNARMTPYKREEAQRALTLARRIIDAVDRAFP
ncbi:MAG: HEPN domain-containing protein [Candidatus Geothermarchaeales archaeon]